MAAHGRPIPTHTGGADIDGDAAGAGSVAAAGVGAGAVEGVDAGSVAATGAGAVAVCAPQADASNTHESATVRMLVMVENYVLAATR